MLEHHSKESVSVLLPSSSTTPFTRQPPGANATMRKYQQLTLAVAAVVSFVAFIFYKHEYERLRYTLEYMDTFGEPPPVDGAPAQQCWFASQPRAATPPAEWTAVAPDIAVYSSYWDDGSGLTEPKLRTVALVESVTHPPSQLKVKLWYEEWDSEVATNCEMEKAEARNHVIGGSQVFHIVFILCTPVLLKNYETLHGVAPYLVQFGTDDGKWTDYKHVHESDSYKSVVDRSAVCVVPSRSPIQSVNVVEFISFYHILGFQKFVFYGNGLTSVTRKLLNKYMDEIGIMVEEKSFNYIPSLQAFLSTNSSKSTSATGESMPDVLEYITRQVVELDCQYRHRDAFENVVVLQANEFILPSQRQSLLDVLKALSEVGGRRSVVSEYHLSTQRVCIDPGHGSGSGSNGLLLSRQTRSSGGLQEAGTAILRPHLLTSSAGQLGVPGGLTQQHVSPASLVVYRYDRCLQGESHSDIVHLPTRVNYVNLIEHSLIYRKWKVYYTVE